MNLKLKKLIDKELKKYPSDKKQSAVIAALAIMQNDRGWLSKEDISEVALYLDMPEIASATASFSFSNLLFINPIPGLMFTFECFI